MTSALDSEHHKRSWLPAKVVFRKIPHGRFACVGHVMAWTCIETFANWPIKLHYFRQIFHYISQP